jgi:hypothetical protein
MNLTRFAENLLKALDEPVHPDNWMERMENVLYALEHGKQRPPEMNWGAMLHEEAMLHQEAMLCGAPVWGVECSYRGLLNPISHCPLSIEVKKKKLEKEMIDHLTSLSQMLSSGELANGDLPFVGWPDPWGIFERCKDFAERIAEEETPSETSAPPVVGESAEGIGQVPQGCEADKKPNWSRVYRKKEAAANIGSGISVDKLNARLEKSPQSVMELGRETWRFDKNDPLFMGLESDK